MKAAVLSLLIFASAAASAAEACPSVVGNWIYDGFLFEGHRYPNPNPNLSVRFAFNADHTGRLFWKRADENGFCERHETWSLTDGVLTQSVTWLNPENDPSCASDPDMQLNRVTETAVTFAEGELDLHLSLNGKDFIYVLLSDVSERGYKKFLSRDEPVEPKCPSPQINSNRTEPQKN